MVSYPYYNIFRLLLFYRTMLSSAYCHLSGPVNSGFWPIVSRTGEQRVAEDVHETRVRVLSLSSSVSRVFPQSSRLHYKPLPYDENANLHRHERGLLRLIHGPLHYTPHDLKNMAHGRTFRQGALLTDSRAFGDGEGFGGSGGRHSNPGRVLAGEFVQRCQDSRLLLTGPPLRPHLRI